MAHAEFFNGGVLKSRGGIEDTRLEAEAKDTKKFRGQGQTLSRPRAQTQVFYEKQKGLQNFFSGEKGLQKNFFRRSLLEETKKRSLQIFRKLSGVFQQISTVQK